VHDKCLNCHPLQWLMGDRLPGHPYSMTSASTATLCSGLWAIGCLAILTAICGCFGGCRVRWCLGAYVVLGAIGLAAQLGLVLYMMCAPGKAEEQLADYQRTKDGQAKYGTGSPHVGALMHALLSVKAWRCLKADVRNLLFLA
jgi:hypothetical protein